MTTENQQMLTQLGLLHDDITQLPAEIRAELATAQAGYNALATDLMGVVKSQMSFTATVDPDEVAPTNTDGGVFTTIAAAIQAAPSGAYCNISLLAGKVYSFNENVELLGRRVLLTKLGNGDDPIIDFIAYADATYNLLYRFSPSYGGSITFQFCHLRLPTARADAALPWTAPCICHYHLANRAAVSLYRSRVSGGIAGDGLGITVLGGGSSVSLNLFVVTIDGPLFGVVGNGIKIINRSSVTLLNGAAILQSGTVGVDVLQY